MNSEFLTQAELRYKQFLFIHHFQSRMAYSDRLLYAESHQTCTVEKQLPGVSQTLYIHKAQWGEYVPIDIELVWRTHLVHPKSYARDTSCLYGKILPHPCRPYRNTMLTYFSHIQMKTASLNPGSLALSENDQSQLFNFVALWNSYFPASDLYRLGSCDRGISSRDQLGELCSVDIYTMATKRTQISVSLKKLQNETKNNAQCKTLQFLSCTETENW